MGVWELGLIFEMLKPWFSTLFKNSSQKSVFDKKKKDFIYFQKQNSTQEPKYEKQISRLILLCTYKHKTKNSLSIIMFPITCQITLNKPENALNKIFLKKTVFNLKFIKLYFRTVLSFLFPFVYDSF